MGLLSSAVSINRYRVEGELKRPILDNIAKGLRLNAFVELDDLSEKSVGWTSFQSPFRPQFRGSSFVFEPYQVFSLRVDKKIVPPKVFKKYFALESAQYLEKTGRSFVTREEKGMLKEKVLAELRSRIPATPEVYDLIWQYEERTVWFFSLLKAANEELETLFAQSFNLTLIRLFPFTIADLAAGLSNEQRDVLLKVSPTAFSR
jgi:hypothetical protein